MHPPGEIPRTYNNEWMDNKVYALEFKFGEVEMSQEWSREKKMTKQTNAVHHPIHQNSRISIKIRDQLRYLAN